MDRLRHHARRPLARTPDVWDAAMRSVPPSAALWRGRRTAIVIEGFLRSGNTYSVAAFQVANGPDLHIGATCTGAPTCGARCGWGYPRWC